MSLSTASGLSWLVNDGGLGLINRGVLSRHFTRAEVVMLCQLADNIHLKLSPIFCGHAWYFWGSQKKTLCLALTLLEIPTSPDLTFICRFKCSQVWACPTEVNRIPFLLTERLQPTSSFHVSGYVVLRSCISEMYRGQSLLYFMRSMEKSSLLSCSPAARWSVMWALRDVATEKDDLNAMHVVQCCSEHCALRPPLLPRLEFLHDIRSGNSSRRMFAFFTDAVLVDLSTWPQAWYNSSAGSRHASFSWEHS